jgi:hypothetical protein
MPVTGTASRASLETTTVEGEEDFEGAVLERVQAHEVLESSALLHTVAAVLHEPPPPLLQSSSASGTAATAAAAAAATMSVLGHSAMVDDAADNDGYVGVSGDGGGGLGEDEDDEEEAEAREGRRLARTNVAGFVVIQRITLAPTTATSTTSGGGSGEEAKMMQGGRLSLLAPCPGKLPSLNLVISSGIKWMEG